VPSRRSVEGGREPGGHHGVEFDEQHFLSTPNGAARSKAGDMIAVDADYVGQTGYLGAGASAAYLATAIGSDPDWIRRVTLNVGRVTAVTATGLQLAEPLLAACRHRGCRRSRS